MIANPTGKRGKSGIASELGVPGQAAKRAASQAKRQNRRRWEKVGPDSVIL